MRAMIAAIGSLSLFCVALPAEAQSGDIEKQESEQLDQGAELITSGRPADGIAILDNVIAANEARHAGSNKLVFCARDVAETLVYMTEASLLKRDAVAVGPTWCDALYLKGYALVDLRRPAEARTYIEKAVTMAPHNAHYRAELAEGYKAERNWDKAYALFEQAAGDARSFSPEPVKKAQLGRAMRGMGFTLIEKGQLDAAEKKFRECLELDPQDERSKSELRYIEEQRAKKAVS